MPAQTTVKGNCLKCKAYKECPRMRGENYCHTARATKHRKATVQKQAR